MEEIQYMLKPGWVTWEQIKECMVRAHEPNRKKGIVMQNQFMSIEEFKEYFLNTTCFVAIKGKEVIGTMSFKIVEMNQWWAKGEKVVYNCADAIIPEYQGTDVYLELMLLREKYIRKSGVRMVQSDTPENNILIRKINAKKKGKEVKLYASPKTWYYSVVMVRWLDGCPYSDWYCNFRFRLSSIIVKLFFKPGRKFRFWLS